MNAPLELGIPGITKAECIGGGAFGTVYKAYQAAFDRTIAVKIMTAPMNDESQTAFERECQAIGRLDGHPNILTVYHAGETDLGHPYILMAYHATGSLAHRLERGVMDWPEVVALGVKVSDALQFAHERNIVHRDVKPENILVSSSGEPVLADFGIAGQVLATHTSDSKGTLLYAAPEVVAGHSASPRSDVYSLAATLFELLNGRPAFLDDGDIEPSAIINRVLTATVPDLRGRGVPDDVCGVIECAMAKTPAERPTSAAAFGAALQGTVPLGRSGRTTRIVSTDELQRKQRPIDSGRRRPPVGALVAIGASLGVLIAGMLISLHSHGTPPPKSSAQPSTSTSVRDSVLSTTPVHHAGSSTTISPVTSPSVPTTTLPTLLSGTVLGRDLQPIAEESCHTPGFANGSSWEVGAVQMNTVTYSASYSCNVFTNGVGSVDFELGRRYQTLTVTVGLADTSSSTNHLVTFTIIGDNVVYLAKPTTIQDGQTIKLSANVSLTSKLTLMIVDMTPAGGTSAPTSAVWGNPVLT